MKPHYLTFLLAIMGLASWAGADVVVKTSGERLSGQIVAESDADVTLVTSDQGITMRVRIARGNIKEIVKEAVAENRYCRVPIHGEIGVDVKAETFGHALEQARQANATLVVLDIDSPGGEVAEMAKIMDLIAKETKLRFVAHVHKAMSAAAMIAMACPTIVVDSRASIGAAVPWQIGPAGTPADIEAKFFAAYETTCKSAAEFAHHSPLLAQGMMDVNLELSLVKAADKDKGNQVLIMESSRVPAGRDDIEVVPFKMKGEILCLSGSEALAAGLAEGQADRVEDLQKVLRLKDFGAVGTGVWNYVEARAASDREAAAANAKKVALAAQKDVLSAQLKDANGKIETLTKAKADALAKMDAVRKEFDTAVKNLPPTVQFDAQQKQLQEKFQGRYDVAAQAASKADLELQDEKRVKEAIEAMMKEF